MITKRNVAFVPSSIIAGGHVAEARCPFYTHVSYAIDTSSELAHLQICAFLPVLRLNASPHQSSFVVPTAFPGRAPYLKRHQY
jgi:hypothetical protein